MNNKNYFFSAAVILLQYLFFYSISRLFKIQSKEILSAFLIFIFLLLKERSYTFDTYLIWDELKKHITAFFQFIIIMSIFSIKNREFSLLLSYCLTASLFTIASFFIIKKTRNKFFKNLKKNLIIIGTESEAKELTEVINDNSFINYDLQGYLFIDSTKEIRIDKNKILGHYSDIEEIVKKVRIDEVIIAVSTLTDKEMNTIVERVENSVSKIKFIPNINKLYTINPSFQDYDGIMLISAKNKMLSRKRQVVKRALDIVGGISGLGILTVLYFVYGKKIKQDGGNALFSHNRIGKNLINFKMHKFRSMYIDAEERLQKMLEENKEIREEFYKTFKLKNDPRVTPVGDFLRRTSLDEFPQFLNVIKGEMSLVGPRPIVQKEIEMYYGEERGKKIFQTKPGITGMWQANGRSDVEDYEERIALDLYYIRNWSMWLDIVILLKTVKNVMKKKGAY